MRRLLFPIISAVVFVMLSMTSTIAQDEGPADITMVSTSNKKPAIFPHKKHQQKLSCNECHHGMRDGKQVAFNEGDTVGKCISCHNSDTALSGVVYKPVGGKKELKLDTLKGAGHGNCLTCHTKVAKKDIALKEIKKCLTCHPKKG